jgi:hypothetical protein
LDANDRQIRVHGSWSGWRSAEIPLADLEDVHWCQPSGAPHRLVHGFVRCTVAPSGELDHHCDGSTPHRVPVCVLKHHVVPSAYAELTRRADAREIGAPTQPIATVHSQSLLLGRSMR